MTDSKTKTAFFYAIYLMGVENGIIEPLESVDPPDLMNDLPDEKRSLVESIRDMDINSESPPDEVQQFYETARTFVNGNFVDDPS